MCSKADTATCIFRTKCLFFFNFFLIIFFWILNLIFNLTIFLFVFFCLNRIFVHLVKKKKWSGQEISWKKKNHASVLKFANEYGKETNSWNTKTNWMLIFIQHCFLFVFNWLHGDNPASMLFYLWHSLSNDMSTAGNNARPLSHRLLQHGFKKCEIIDYYELLQNKFNTRISSAHTHQFISARNERLINRQ